MDNRNKAPARGTQKKGGLLAQPRKVVSGMVFSGTIVGMLLVTIAFSITLSVLSALLERPIEGGLDQTDAYKYLSYLLYQAVYIAVIAVFMKVYGEKPKQFGYRPAHWKYFLIALLLTFGLLFSLNYLNGWFVELLGLMGYTDPAAGSFEEAVAQLPSLAGGGFVGVLVVVALLPAVLEETLFRGIILDGIKDIGTVAACLLGGLLFSVFHQNPSQTLYQFICGCAFTLLAVRADSLLPAVLCHFLNNAVIVCNYKFAFLQNVPSSVAVVLYVISGVCLAGSLVYLIFFDKKTNRRKEGEIKPFFLAALVGFILCCVLWVYSLVVNIAG